MLHKRLILIIIILIISIQTHAATTKNQGNLAQTDTHADSVAGSTIKPVPSSDPNDPKGFCTPSGWLCASPAFYHKGGVGTDKNLGVDVNSSYVELNLVPLQSAFFIRGKFSLLPLIVGPMVEKDGRHKINRYSNDLAGQVDAGQAAAYNHYQSEIRGVLDQMGLVRGSPQYNASFQHFWGIAKSQIDAEANKKDDLIASGREDALHQLDTRKKELTKQDSFQEFVVGIQDDIFHFKIGKSVAGTGFEDSYGAEKSSTVNHVPIPEKAMTSGFPRFVFEVARKFHVNEKLDLTLVAWGGKEGRLFLGAEQDTQNFLRMNDNDYAKEKQLFGVDSGGVRVSFQGVSADKSEHPKLDLVFIETESGPNPGALVHVPLSSDVLLKVSYIYAQRRSAKGHLVRGEVNFNLNTENLWDAQIKTVATLFASHADNIQNFSSYDISVQSNTGYVEQDRVGVALSFDKVFHPENIANQVELGASMEAGWNNERLRDIDHIQNVTNPGCDQTSSCNQGFYFNAYGRVSAF